MYLLKVCNFLLKQLNIEAAKLQRGGIFYIVGVNMK